MSEFTPSVVFESHYRTTDESLGAIQESWDACFFDFCGQIEARKPDQVISAMDEVQDAVENGCHAAGFMTYEAASGFEPVMQTHELNSMPLLWFGLFKRREVVPLKFVQKLDSYTIGNWQPSMNRSAYSSAVADIHGYIAKGDTYQVNFTNRLRAPFSGDDAAFFVDLCKSQRSRYCAFVDIGSHAILSASPELFFSLRDGRLRMRPMKGTRHRGRWLSEDNAIIAEMSCDPKERAENVMIVDMLRNDLGRISTPGSIVVEKLWETERYETVNQLVSHINSQINHGVRLTELFQALFPCGSVTGAPKIRTMELISELEKDPRGVYTGCIGYISPIHDRTSKKSCGNFEACFNVAIRTVCIDREQECAEYGVGSGVTHDSSDEGEFEECRIKARVLTERRPEFDLFETLRFESVPTRTQSEKNSFNLESSYFLLDRHLSRLCDSAAFFGFVYDEKKIRQELVRYAENINKRSGYYRVKVILTRCGDLSVEGQPLKINSHRPIRVVIARDAVSSEDIFLYHKTTHRSVYEQRLSAHRNCEEVLLQNERGELTEGTLGNVVVVLGGCRWTPQKESGLLAGTYRNELLNLGEIKERVIKVEEIQMAEKLYLINSVRCWVPLELFREEDSSRMVSLNRVDCTVAESGGF
tara:strand:- start:1046 stop:2977 length:1932 start_codon:yes stop_codon:yes gene_type:complete